MRFTLIAVGLLIAAVIFAGLSQAGWSHERRASLRSASH
jgi:hypothetical protein